MHWLPSCWQVALAWLQRDDENTSIPGQTELEIFCQFLFFIIFNLSMLSSRLGSTYCSLPLATLHQTPNNSGYNSLSKLSLVSTSKKKKILFLWFQLKDIVFKCSHARGNPTAVTGTECQIKLHYLWNQVVSILNGPWKSTWLEHNCPKAVYTSLFCPCSTVRQLLTSHDNAALSLRQWKILRRKQGSFTSGRKSWEAALGTAWALWVGGKQNRSTALLPGHSS